MKNSRKMAFSGSTILFALNILIFNLCGMEQEPSNTRKRSPLSLTQLAADAYINSFKRQGTFNDQSALEMQQELEEKCHLASREIQEIVHQRLNRDNNTFTEQNIPEEMIAILPDSNQIVTKGFAGDNNNSISFWSLYSPDNNPQNALLTGFAGTLPYARQNIALNSMAKKDRWINILTLELPEAYAVKYVTENIIICGIITESENNDSLFDQKKIALFVKSKNTFKCKQIIEVEQSVTSCAFLPDDNMLALALEDNSIVLFGCNKDKNIWEKSETIENVIPKESSIRDIAFLRQSYQENPLIFIHGVNADNDTSSLSFVHCNKNIWHYNKVIDKAHFLEVHTSHDARTITVHTRQDDEDIYKEETHLIEECKDHNQLYTMKSFDTYRHFSCDNTLSVHREFDSLHITELYTGDPVRNIKMGCWHVPMFITNNTIAIRWGNHTKILTLKSSVAFSLCNKVLQESEKKENIDLNALVQSPLMHHLSPDEKKRIEAKSEQLKQEQSFKGKINHLRKQCKQWAYRNPNKHALLKATTYTGLALTSMYIHSKVDHNFSFLKNYCNNSQTKMFLCLWIMHSGAASSLTYLLNKLIFRS